jgi:hypothetical protein
VKTINIYRDVLKDTPPAIAFFVLIKQIKYIAQEFSQDFRRVLVEFAM